MKSTFCVKFEVKELMLYEVEAESMDEAIQKAQEMADLDYHGDADFLDVWEQ